MERAHRGVRKSGEAAGGKRPVAREVEAVRVPPGRRVVDCPPTELPVGDQVMAGGSFVDIVDLRYRHGGTRTVILRGGAVCVAERTIRVYRLHVAR
ncbi:hypothetical protein [Streptomyces sp. NPDC001717]|uniref:hypothetical protein n=1 Tax=Streptomyces sp. NPDC001717 TaxID=3364604 RepID=UPI0036977895